MASPDEDKVFDDEEIRDTANHNSSESVSGIYKAKTIIVENGLNQIATFQLQGARDSVWMDIGSSFDVSASANSFQTVETYFPKYRIQASCSIAPTTGSLDIWIIKASL